MIQISVDIFLNSGLGRISFDLKDLLYLEIMGASYQYNMLMNVSVSSLCYLSFSKEHSLSPTVVLEVQYGFFRKASILI